MIIQIQIRNVYGNDIAYPVNREAECIARIAGTKTLTRNSLHNLLSMGCTIQEVDRHGQHCRSYTGSDVCNGTKLPAVA